MVGKKNVVFGFIFLVFTAALGPYMLAVQFPVFNEASGEKQQEMARIAQARADGYEMDLEEMSAADIAKMNSDGLLAMNKADNARAPIDAVRSGPHVHGNLEALLNIVVGIALGSIAVAAWLKQMISWFFIVGTLLHSGLLYLHAFGFAWAFTLLQTGIGPMMVLLGLLAAGIAAAMGWRGELIRD